MTAARPGKGAEKPKDAGQNPEINTRVAVQVRISDPICSKVRFLEVPRCDKLGYKSRVQALTLPFSRHI